MNIYLCILIPLIIAGFLFMVLIPKKWFSDNIHKCGVNPSPSSPRPEAPNLQGFKPIKEIVIRIENCFNCPFSVKSECPYCCINRITFSSGIPTDRKLCWISKIILR
jgi:hypothetical protein